VNVNNLPKQKKCTITILKFIGVREAEHEVVRIPNTKLISMCESEIRIEEIP